MKDKVIAVHVCLSEYNSVTAIDRAGTIVFFRHAEDKENKIRLSSNIVVPAHRVARALEAQRLFLSQLEKATK